MIYSLILLCLSLFPQTPAIIEFKGMENDKGRLFVRIRTEEGKTVYAKAVQIENKRSSILLPVDKLTKVGIEVYHDENGNQKLDKNLVGFPTEKWAVSNYRPKLRAPELSEILVPISPGTKIELTLE